MLLAYEPLEFQLFYPLGSEELKFCCFYYVEMFQRFRLSFQVCFSWQTILLLFFFFFFAFSSSEAIQLRKVILLFKSLLAEWPNMKFLSVYYEFSGFKEKRVVRVTTIYEFILWIFKSLR